MRGWRGGAAALLVAAVLLPAPLLLKRRAAAPADEWRGADVDRALDRVDGIVGRLASGSRGGGKSFTPVATAEGD